MNLSSIHGAALTATNRVLPVTTELLERYPAIFWTLLVLISFRILIAFVYLFIFRRLRQPGVPNWPRVAVSHSMHWVHCPRYLTPWRYFFVSRFSALLVKCTRYTFVALLISLIPHPIITNFFSLKVRAALTFSIAGAWILDRTRLHRILGAWIAGATTDAILTRRFLFILRFYFGIIPFLRCYRRGSELGLSTMVQPHEQAPEERNLPPQVRPVFSDSWLVIVRLGQQPVTVATVFGKLDADKIANGFASIREELEKDRGVFKRAIADGAWAFGGTKQRAE